MPVRFVRTWLLGSLLGLLLGKAGWAQDGAWLAYVDSLWQQGAFAEALALLNDSLQRTPNAAELLWRRSRVRVELGMRASEKQQQRALYWQALEDAQAAIAADSLNSQAYVAAAIAAGRLALVSGARAKVEHARQIRAYIDRALALDPNDDVAYHLRGRWHYEVATLSGFERTLVRLLYGGLPDASLEEAASDFRRALAIRERVVHHLELGRTLLRLGDRAGAIRELKRALALPPTEPSDTTYQEDARRLLGRIR
ncbi:tetratricopeptide repeat protein [Rhodothermus profundi]|uniref:Regulator of microtubule dynamics protein 1 n=1 Tax=Rhodothermus profundi TaxID=633813 RepID=A0A1M6QF29_9BACT|nr:tetratricopeptide repeat protein [Rhodothermus profundi]SHK18657.1 Tetratricopeptide repeat-containing protein [Rhodothermus profundi]